MWKFVREVGFFCREAVHKRRVIYELAKRDLQAQSKGSYLGVAWQFIHPLAYIFVLVFIFAVGLRSNPAQDVPFVVFLISGMIAWQFFQSNINGLTRIVAQHSYLIKKGKFSLPLLHIAKLLSSLAPHLLTLAITLIVCWIYHFPPSLYILQLFYYLGAMCLFLLGLGWITSSTSLFVEDVGNVVSIMTQFGFWLTPIIWNIKRVTPQFRWIFRLNPMTYIVDGYRDSLIYQRPFWEKPLDTLYFWAVTALALGIGVKVFRKLKPHLGEVVR